jgi:hypothetical protein
MKAFAPRPLAAAVTVSFSLLTLLGPAKAARADDVHFETSDPGFELWNRTNQVAMVPVRVGRSVQDQRSYVFEPLCRAMPCTANLAPGSHVLAISQPGEELVTAESRVTIDGPADLTATYHDRSSLRGLGILISAAVPAAGLGLVYASTHQTGAGANANGEPSIDPALFGLGLGLAVSGIIAGLVMAFTKDKATFTVTPLLALGASPKREDALAGRAGMNGLAVGIRF